MNDGTRVSGSFSNLSDSGRRTAARLGLRRRSTVGDGASDGTEATLNSASLSRPSHALTLTSCRVTSTSATEQRHSTRLEALTDVPLELRSSRLLEVSTALFELNRRTAVNGWRQFTSSKFARADGTQLFSRSGDLVTSATATQAYTAGRPAPRRHRCTLPRHRPGTLPAATYTCTP